MMEFNWVGYIVAVAIFCCLLVSRTFWTIVFSFSGLILFVTSMRGLVSFPYNDGILLTFLKASSN